MQDLQKAGKYEILERIGEGGFGVVYKGRDPFIKRLVAIKTCTSSSEETRRRFLREAEIAGNIEHPNITVVYDFGFQDDVPYLVQEFLSGEDLDHLVERRDRLSLTAKLNCLLQAASGLGFAHEQGITHRDIKPANLRILEDGRIKIMDFGIAKVAGVDTQLTQTGTTLGTPAYLSPEQLRGDVVDQRSDIYSFGVLAFELLTYRRLFEAETISSLFYQILHQTPQRLKTLWPEAPQEVDDLIAACVEKAPEDRPQTFEPIVQRLESVLAQLDGGPDHFLPESAQPPKRGADPEQLRQEAMTAARNHIENLLASGQLDAAKRALHEAHGSFGDQVPFRTLQDRLQSLETDEPAAASPPAAPEREAVVSADEVPAPPTETPEELADDADQDAHEVDDVLAVTRQLVHDRRLTLAEEKLEEARGELGERPELLAVSRQIKLRRRLEEGQRAIDAGDLLAAGRLLEHAGDIDPESTELLHLRKQLHEAVARKVDEPATDPGTSPSAGSQSPPNLHSPANKDSSPSGTASLPPELSEAPTILTTWDELQREPTDSEPEQPAAEATASTEAPAQAPAPPTSPPPEAASAATSLSTQEVIPDAEPSATEILPPSVADVARGPRKQSGPSLEMPAEPSPIEPFAGGPGFEDAYTGSAKAGSTGPPWRMIAIAAVALVGVLLVLKMVLGGDEETPPVTVASVSVLLDARPWAVLEEIRVPGGDGEPIEVGPITLGNAALGNTDPAHRSTPLRLQLAPGEYEFVLAHPQTDEPTLVTVSVPAQSEFSYTADLTAPELEQPAISYLEQLGLAEGTAP